MLKYIILVILLFNIANSQITFVDTVKVPSTDAGTNAAEIEFSPPTMQSGDLVVVCITVRNASEGITNSVAGGQSWTAEDTISYTNNTMRVFWCQYNGSWTANPKFTSTYTTCITGWFTVWRGTTGCSWMKDQAQVETRDGSSPWASLADETVYDTTLSLYFWTSPDDNTWSDVTGTGWTTLGSQTRNMAGSDNSITAAFNRLYTATSAVEIVSKTQSANGPDVTIIAQNIWRMYTPLATPAKRQVIGMMPIIK